MYIAYIQVPDQCVGFSININYVEQKKSLLNITKL